MTRIIVTGGSGFVGRHTVKLLQREGYDVFKAEKTLGFKAKWTLEEGIKDMVKYWED